MSVGDGDTHRVLVSRTQRKRIHSNPTNHAPAGLTSNPAPAVRVFVSSRFLTVFSFSLKAGCSSSPPRCFCRRPRQLQIATMHVETDCMAEQPGGFGTLQQLDFAGGVGEATC